MLTSFKRVTDFAIKDFSRNKGISVAAIFVLTITIMLVTGLWFFQAMAGFVTSQLQDKIDITAYFKNGTQEQDILNAKVEISKMAPNIKNIEYVSADQALANFNALHKNDTVIAQALQEVGENPLEASLSITTNGNPSQYAQVANILKTSDFSSLIDNVDFSQKEDIIKKVYSITSGVNTYGLILEIIFIFIAMLVVYNTIKLAIENSKEEIVTMKIVGASDWFVRGPFMIQGIIYGIVSFLICIFLTAISVYFLSPEIENAVPGFNMFGYFLTNWWIFVLIQLGFGVIVGVVSSLIVVRKHLDI